MLFRTAALALAALTLSGCSGGSDPSPGALPTLSPTPSATPTLAPVPPAATALTPQGADAFARYFYDQLNEAFRTSDAAIITALSTSACRTCGTYIDGLTEAKSKGRFFNGTTFLVTAVAAAPADTQGTSVDVVGSLPARDEVDAQGRILRHVEAHGRFHFVLELRYVDRSWKVIEIAEGKT